MGMRQSLGLVSPDLARDFALTMADFTLAIAIQNLAAPTPSPALGW
jgi:hypothetical protein